MRESLADSRQPFMITATFFVHLENAARGSHRILFSHGTDLDGHLDGRMRRRVPVSLKWMLMLLLVTYYVSKEQWGRAASATGLFLAVSVVHCVLYICRERIVKYARLEPALEL